MKLIVGLGNPGTEYEKTRHNVGFVCVENLAALSNLVWQEQKKCHASIAKGMIHGIPVLLAKPTTFMNRSGEAVQALLSYYKITPENLLIVQDEMDLEPGRLAFLAKGGAAGHNGITNIQERLGTTAVSRLRLGVGRPQGQIPKEDWVLGQPNAEDEQRILTALQEGPKAVTSWIRDGLPSAMNTWNRTP